MNKPIAVLISDIHYSLPNLSLADAALRLAIAKANELKTTLVVAGDLHDSKANLRGECVNALIETFSLCDLPPYVLVGNHDKINEKSEDHCLNFLRPHAMVIDHPVKQPRLGYLIPYYSDSNALKVYLKTLPKNSQIIMHQGLELTNAGHYIQDKSAISPQDVAGHRIISGHYHTRQTIKLPNSGQWDYLGNPYTLNYGEAIDPSKGFQVLYDDGSLEFIPVNLRRHIVWDIEYNNLKPELVILDKTVNWKVDLLSIKIRGTREQLVGVTKSHVESYFNMSKHPFKLDLIPTNDRIESPKTKLVKGELLDSIIDSLSDSQECKIRLKLNWRNLCE